MKDIGDRGSTLTSLLESCGNWQLAQTFPGYIPKVNIEVTQNPTSGLHCRWNEDLKGEALSGVSVLFVVVCSHCQGRYCLALCHQNLAHGDPKFSAGYTYE